MKKPEESATALIDPKIKQLGDWRGKTLAGPAGAKGAGYLFSHPQHHFPSNACVTMAGGR
jgi:hypothetical protein